MLNRREWLGASLAAGTLASGPRWLSRAAAQSAPAAGNDRVLVVLALRGGNDGLNTVVPFEDERYYRARPTLALPRAKLLPLDELNAFHPSLPHTARCFAEGEMTIVQGVGYPNPNLSHFRSMDIWDAAAAADPLPAQGWIGQAQDALPKAPARGRGADSAVAMLAVGPEALPRALWSSGGGSGMACALPDLESYQIRSSHRRAPRRTGAARQVLLDRLHESAPDGPEQELRWGYRAARESIEELRRAGKVDLATRFPRSGLGRDLALVARVMQAGLPTRFFHVAQGGYDTHTSQLQTHKELLRELDLALDAFRREMRVQGRDQRVMVLVVSEFGRRVQESGTDSTAGTDHGAASTVMVFGGATRGGMIGEQPDLDDLDENGNLVFRTDFRRVYASVLEDWIGVDSTRVLRERFEPLELLRS